MDRRGFLKTVPLAAAVPVLTGIPSLRELFIDDDDAVICSKKFELAASLRLQSKPIGDVIVEMGRSFLGTEYVANTLEQPGEEHLVINLHGLDCVSFYENSLVFARCIKKGKTTFEDYKKELQWIRYRGGIINGYTSRLHYSSDYFFDNEKKHVLKVVTKDIGGVRFEKSINFMSTHPDSYRQLKDNPELVATIRKQEAAINSRELYHIPTHTVAKVAPKIHNGDILAITTDIPGMDVSHTGLAIWVDDRLHFLHAPITGSKVQITEKTLAEYLASSPKRLGIMVARPLEPF
ncbi:MAG TPA: N-acetylmuramoyl-L-alanine amidase-like domain-containing protein [Bacteroidota bacterium]|nr:N-acetylmuramoyl-L-alanine amidase-like domain-containing protein [Bacteroidota bacterium]